VARRSIEKTTRAEGSRRFSGNCPKTLSERGDMFDPSSTDRLVSLFAPDLPRLVGVYRTLDGYTFVFEWFDGDRFAAVEPLGVVVAVPRSQGVFGGRHVS
jgi:hypothetical protein